MPRRPPGAIGAAILLCAAAAGAQKPATAAPDSGDRLTARTRAAIEALNAGIDRFEQGRAAEAEAQFQIARDLVPDKPKPYFWLARAQAEQGRCGDALPNLRAFIKRVPADHPNYAQASALLSRCEAERGPPAPPPVAPLARPPEPTPVARPAAPSPERTIATPPGGAPAPPDRPVVTPPPPVVPAPARAATATAKAPPPSARGGLRGAGIGLLVAGAVIAGGGGTAFGLLAADQGAQVVNQGQQRLPLDPALDERGRLYQALSIASLVVGGAAAVAGAVMVGLGARGEAARPISLAPQAGPGFAGLALGGSL